MPVMEFLSSYPIKSQIQISLSPPPSLYVYKFTQFETDRSVTLLVLVVDWNVFTNWFVYTFNRMSSHAWCQCWG